jgi:hypothetical protein
MVEPKRTPKQSRFVHESRGLTLSAPSPWTACAAAIACLLLALLFATATAIGLRGQAPPWGSGHEIANIPFRVLLGAIGLACGCSAIVLTAAYLDRMGNLLKLRLRLIPVMESEGPCRLVQEGPDRWGLELALDRNDDGSPARHVIEEALETPRYPWEPGPAHCRLFFRLDEADVARLSRIFDPDEELRLQWADLPLHSGGPTLLGVRTPAKEVQMPPLRRVRTSDRKKIRTIEPPDREGGLRAA